MSRPCLQLTVSVFAALLGSLVAVVQHQVPTNDYNLVGPSTPLPSQPVTFPVAFKTPQPHDHEHGPYVAGKYEDPFALTWSNLAANVDPNWLLGVLFVLAPEIIQMAGTSFSAVRGRMERTRDTINKLSNIAVWFFALDTAQVAIELLPSFKWSTVRGILHGIVTRMELFVYSSICGALVYTELTHPGLVWFSWRDVFCWPAIMYALFFRPWECVPLPIDPLAGLFFVIGHARPEHAAVSPPFAALVTAGWWAISTSVKIFTRRTAARRTAAPVNQGHVK